MRTYFPILLVFVVTLGVFSSTASSQAYRLIDVQSYLATDLNDSDEVVTIDWPGGDLFVSSVWKDGSKQGLGTLYPGGSTEAYGINRAGQVVGSSWSPGNAGSRHAFRWQNGIMTDLGTLGGPYSEARDINDSGHVAGRSIISNDTGIFHGFVWEGGSMTDLGTLGIGSFGAAINNIGQIAGQSEVNDTLRHAFRWQNGSMSDLGTLGGNLSDARGINNLGQVVGSSTKIAASESYAFIASNGGMTDLGFLAAPDPFPGFSEAFSINDSTEVVGASSWVHSLQGNLNHAFVWRDGVMTDLNNVADTAGGWELIVATAVNNRGDILATAIRSGRQQAVLLKKSQSIVLTSPRGGERSVSGDQDTIRWLNGLPPGSNVILWYSINDGQSWRLIENAYPAVLGRYVWTIPDTTAAHARIKIESASNDTLFDESGPFVIKGYVLTKFSPTNEYLEYNSASDRWGFGNTPYEVWPLSWTNKFDYSGIDPYTGASYATGQPVTTEIFLNALSADHPDWISFVRTFGVTHCYQNVANSTYSPTAVLRWASVKGVWGGSCFGFAISNAIAFRYKFDFRNKYTRFPDYDIAYDVHSDTNTIPVINEVFTHQFGEPHQSNFDAVSSKTPNVTLRELKERLLSDEAAVHTFNIYNNHGSGAHSVLPYKVWKDPSFGSIYRIGVYDNAHNGVLNAEITIDTAGNGGNGTWEFPLWPGWGGDAGLVLADPSVLYLNNPTLPKHPPERSVTPFLLSPNTLEIHPISGAAIRVLDTLGGEIGYSDSVIHNTLPGAHPLMLLNGSASPPYGYRLPTNRYAITLSDFPGDKSHVFLSTGNRTFLFDRSGSSSTQTDHLTFDGSLSVSNPDTGSKTINLTDVVNKNNLGIGEYVWTIGSLPISMDDSVRIENLPADGLKLNMYGSDSRTYRLGLELDASTGSKRFRHDQVTLDGNSSHIIQPDWNAISPGSNLKILIDLGNDGTIDDSIFVQNEVTGVREGLAAGIPSEFKLYQNFPNPFNPRTIISYEIPTPTPVVLKVYDLFGREVATLVDGVQDAGFKSVQWDATGMASGVYFYRLSAGRFTQTRKLVLVR
ncbi:MAG TPA: T9SS type A sorting domain-containing protein [Bacteroidota bacterium]